MGSAQVAAQVEKIVLTRIQGDRLDMPSPPQVAQKCLALTRDAGFQVKKAVGLLEKDPMLAARVIRTASSAAFGGQPAANLTVAVNRLGTQKLRTVLLEASTRELFNSPDRAIAAQMTAIWRHSLAVAIVARDLATLTGGTEAADVAYLGGLMHDVGKTIVATVLLEAERALGKRGAWMGADDWIGVVGAIHRPLGVALAEKWELPGDIVGPIRDCSDYDSADRGTAGNYVRFANAVAKKEGLYPGKADVADAEALIMIGRSLLGIEDDVLNRITQGLGERVNAQSLG